MADPTPTPFSNDTDLLTNTLGGMPPGGPPPAYIQRLKLANQVVLAVTFSVVVFAMGAAIVPKDFKIVLRRPVGVLVGFASQFVVMPLLAFCYALAVDLESAVAIGCLILACSPGGSLSNLYTFWTDGDVCLSIVMTTISTLLAIGMMPLNLLIYSRRWTDQGTTIPYLDIFIALILIIVPVALGMLLRWKRERWALAVAKPCSLVGFLGIMCSIIIISVIDPGLYSSHWTIWLGAILLAWIGFSLGYLLAFIARQTHAQCRTIGFETGVQNVALSFTIISFSFKGSSDFVRMLTFPALFGPLSVISGLLATAGFRIYVYMHPRAPADEGQEGTKDGKGADEQKTKDDKKEDDKKGDDKKEENQENTIV